VTASACASGPRSVARVLALVAAVAAPARAGGGCDEETGLAPGSAPPTPFVFVDVPPAESDGSGI